MCEVGKERQKGRRSGNGVKVLMVKTHSKDDYSAQVKNQDKDI